MGWRFLALGRSSAEREDGFCKSIGIAMGGSFDTLVVRRWKAGDGCLER